MQYCILPLLLLIFVPSCQGQKSIGSQNIDLRTHSSSHHNSDQLAEKYEYYYDYWSEREIKHGKISRWNKEGVLIYEANYKDNELDGIEEIFNEEGNLISSIDWKMGVKDGKEIQYYDSGGEKLIIPYKSGLKEGLEKSYYRSGRIKWVITYRAGKKDGAANYFKKDGALKKSLIYENGIKQKEKKEKTKKTPEKTAHEITI